MKVIGRIEPQRDSDGYAEDAKYIDGIIVQLTASEATTLCALQDALDDYGWTSIEALLDSHRRGSLPKDDDISDAFTMIKYFVMAKFEVNAMRQMVDRLDDLLCALEDKEESVRQGVNVG